VVTARDAFQVCELADFHGMEYRKIGRHYGKNKLAKVLGLFVRAAQLMPFTLKEKPVLGLSHGSRAQMIACNLLRIPTILVADYEHAQTPPLMRPKWELAPEAIPEGTLHCRNGYSRKYSGIKEDVYAWTLVPEHSVLKELGVHDGEIFALVRPPATEAHYHNPESEVLFERAMERLCKTVNVRVVLLPRNHRQELWMRSRWAHWFEGNRVVVPKRALDGLNLIWHADLVISGGGTMNRESAALGVPVYSVFRGPIGAVDKQLQAEGRLILLTSLEEVDRKIAIRKRDRQNTILDGKPRKALREIVDHVEAILAIEQESRLSQSGSAR
jgi:predicted glycosyltransferase